MISGVGVGLGSWGFFAALDPAVRRDRERTRAREKETNFFIILTILSVHETIFIVFFSQRKSMSYIAYLDFPHSFSKPKQKPRPGGTETYHPGRGFVGIQKGRKAQAKVREPMPTWALVWASKRTMLSPTTFMETGSSTA